ncbi:MAG: penicillin-binding protein 1A [Thermodesulfobacteriota bacterium]
MTKKEKNNKKPRKSLLKKITLFFFIAFVFVIISGVASLTGLYYYYSKDLPKIKSLADYNPPQVTEVFSDSGDKIAEFYKQKRYIIDNEKMPAHLIKAFVAAEDSRFYEHGGIDLLSIVRAFYKNIFAGQIVQGGSTITQQVAKSFFLSPEKSYERKIKEAILAYRIDKFFSKEDILYLYLNQIYLGNGAYGVEAAARSYFGKNAENLLLSESAMLAGLPQAPSRYSPLKHFERARKRQHYVLRQMIQNNYITPIEAANAKAGEIILADQKNYFMEKTPYYSAYVKKYLLDKYGEKKLFRSGLKIYTAVSEKMQEQAKKDLNKGLRELDKRQGYRGPIKNLKKEDIQSFLENQKDKIKEEDIKAGLELKAVVTEVNNEKNHVMVKFEGYSGILPLENMSWARKPDPQKYYLYHKIKKPGHALKKNDLILIKLEEKNQENDLWTVSLEQTPEVSGSILCIEAGTGEVKAMIGGKSFVESQFNRAVQSKRQPGSAFKPVIYSAALDKGYTAASMIMDNAFVFYDKEQDFTWKPQNYNEKFYGPTLLRKALALSINLVTIKLTKEIGIDYLIDYSRKLGIESNLDRNYSLALGSSGMTLLEITNAYSVFANKGKLIDPVFIKKIEDSSGDVLEESDPGSNRVIPKETAFIMTSMMKSVVTEGTGWRAKKLDRPAAGKTGTTNNLHDAWFIGYTTDYITGTWVGYDQARTLGINETGSKAACPVWVDFMQEIHKGIPEKDFEVPDNIIYQKIDAKTGLLPGPDTEKTIYESFVKGTEPKVKTPEKEKIDDKTEFFKYGM